MDDAMSLLCGKVGAYFAEFLVNIIFCQAKLSLREMLKLTSVTLNGLV